MSEVVLPLLAPPATTTAEDTLNYGCLLFDLDDSERNKSLTTEYFHYEADVAHGKSQLRSGGMFANGEGVPLDEGFSTAYFDDGLAKGSVDRGRFMISPNKDVLFNNTTTLAQIRPRIINFQTSKIKFISIPASVEALFRLFFSR
jgi:hypothetical protein